MAEGYQSAGGNAKRGRDEALKPRPYLHCPCMALSRRQFSSYPPFMALTPLAISLTVHHIRVFQRLGSNQTRILRESETEPLLLQLQRVALQRKDVVGEDDDLVAAPLVEPDQELARTELVWIRHVQQLNATE